jgi:hypothetical protein
MRIGTPYTSMVSSTKTITVKVGITLHKSMIHKIDKKRAIFQKAGIF